MYSVMNIYFAVMFAVKMWTLTFYFERKKKQGIIWVSKSTIIVSAGSWGNNSNYLYRASCPRRPWSGRL